MKDSVYIYDDVIAGAKDVVAVPFIGSVFRTRFFFENLALIRCELFGAGRCGFVHPRTGVAFLYAVEAHTLYFKFPPNKSIQIDAAEYNVAAEN